MPIRNHFDAYYRVRSAGNNPHTKGFRCIADYFSRPLATIKRNNHARDFVMIRSRHQEITLCLAPSISQPFSDIFWRKRVTHSIIDAMTRHIRSRVNTALTQLTEKNNYLFPNKKDIVHKIITPT